MSEMWHYSRGPTQYGPVAASELRRLAASGRLSPGDLVWKEGLADWVEARRLQGLFATGPSAAEDVPRDGHAKPAWDPEGTDLRYRDGPLIEGIHQQRLFIAILGGAGILATFMPWVRVPFFGSIAGSAVGGWMTLVLFMPAFLLAMIGDKRHPIVGGSRLGATVPAGFAALIGFAKVADAQMGMSLPVTNAEALSYMMNHAVYAGVGPYVVIAAGASVCAVAWTLERSPVFSRFGQR